MSKETPGRMGRLLQRIDSDPRVVVEAAAPRQVLVSEAVQVRIEDQAQLKRRWCFSAKGAPKGLKVYAAEPS